MAQIGWIDFNNRDRKKAQQLMTLIRPEGQLDELGVGYIRDALGNLLFPGISTIQTRAKYFFLIPHIFRDFQHLKPTERRRTTAKSFLKDREHLIKNTLRKQYDFKEGLGIIGVTLKDRQYIKRNPSEIYWAGLQVYGFMNGSGLSREQYLRNLAAQQPLELTKTASEEDDADSTYEEQLHLQTPVNNNWLEDLQIELTKDEGDFFTSQILHTATEKPLSLLPQLFNDNVDLLDHFIGAKSFQQFVISTLDFNFSKAVKDLLILAYDFALLMEGVHLLYNHLLQKYFFEIDYENKFQDEWINWSSTLRKDMIDYKGFNPVKLFGYTRRMRQHTELFISKWWQLIIESDARSLPSADMLQLVRQREQISKGKKSRLTKPVSANTDIELNKRIGLSLFQYRFYNARVIVEDMVKTKNL